MEEGEGEVEESLRAMTPEEQSDIDEVMGLYKLPTVTAVFVQSV